MNNIFKMMSRPIVIAFLILICLSCQKENTIQSLQHTDIGIVTGIDMSLCFCCGGWFIDIDDSTYRFHKLPDNSSINLYNESLPLLVRIKWKPDPDPCAGDEIIVLKISKL